MKFDKLVLVNEKIIANVNIMTLSSRQYCIIENYVNDENVNQLGKKLLRRGECSFFPHPSEIIEGPMPVMVLSDDLGLVLRAEQDFDDDGTARKAGLLAILCTSEVKNDI